MAFPNFFITIGPAEWLFPQHCSASAYYDADGGRGHDVVGFASIHLYRIVRDTMEGLLTEKHSRWFVRVFHYLIRLEYQQRGTPHFHIALWCIPKFPPTHYIGRTGMSDGERIQAGRQRTSEFHSSLEQLFSRRSDKLTHIDVQWTTGRLNYINGYTTKAHDALDFRLDSETIADHGQAR